MTSCERMEGLLSLFEMEELDELTRDEVVVHLEVCDACCGTLAAYRALSEACAQDAALELPEEVSKRVLGRLHAELPREESRPAAPAPEVMTMEEAARFLRVELEDLESELDGLPCFEFAGRLRIRKSALEEWIETRERTSRRRRLLSVVEG